MSECFICGNTFNLHNSDDVPCYLFEGSTRKERERKADKYGVRLLCKRHHYEYDLYLLRSFLSSIDEHPNLEHWEDVKNYQIELSKNINLHSRFIDIAIKVLAYYFDGYNYDEEKETDRCISCGCEMDIEDIIFRNLCDKCNSSQDNEKEILY